MSTVASTTRPRIRPSLVMGGQRESGTVILVAGLASFYAATLALISAAMETLAKEAPGLRVVLMSVSSVFIGIALYVAVVVMSGCVATVIAGRLPRIAMLRLLGAQGKDLRRSVARSCALSGLIGSLAGLVIAIVVSALTRTYLMNTGRLPRADYPWVTTYALVMVLPVIAAAALAGLIGSRRVLAVTPAQAMSGVAAPGAEKGTSRVRAVLGVLLIVVGAAGLGLGAVLGEDKSSAGFLIAFFGSAISATGILVGAPFVVPAVVRGCARILGDTPVSRIARRNAVGDPMRTTRSTIGLIVGVTLVTTFAAGFAALQTAKDSWDMSPQEKIVVDQIISITSTVMICLVLISCIISAVGFVSTMSLTVLQRGREIGLLRALGFTTSQIRAMITRESIALGATAVVAGVVMGLVYGALGAQSLIGALNDGFIWGIPGPALAAIAVSGVLLVLVASQPPARGAVQVTPVAALRIDA